MKLSNLNKLRERVWFKPLEEDPLEVCLVPAEAHVAVGDIGGSVDPEVEVARVCSRVFLDFRGVEDDSGAPVPNSVDARKTIYRHPLVRMAIRTHLFDLNQRAIQGEAEGASD